MSLEYLERLIAETCDEYVKRWKTEGYIKISSLEQAYLENNETPIEREATITAKLVKLSKENPNIPPTISMLPIQLLKKLPLYLTKTLEIQINQDHYEFWSWSSETFKLLEDSSPLLKYMKSNSSQIILDLLFHICLARLNFKPSTQEAMMLNRIIDDIIDIHVKNIIYNKFLIGIPIGAATLETILKAWIKLMGNEEAKKDLENKEKKGKATLGSVLDIFDDKVLPYASEDFKAVFLELNKVIENIWRQDWKEILPSWRNNFMHGGNKWAPRAFAVYINYICLIVWHTISPEEYNKKKVILLNKKFLNW
jgi:hypothetical protein